MPLLEHDSRVGCSRLVISFDRSRIAQIGRPTLQLRRNQTRVRPRTFAIPIFRSVVRNVTHRDNIQLHRVVVLGFSITCIRLARPQRHKPDRHAKQLARSKSTNVYPHTRPPPSPPRSGSVSALKVCSARIAIPTSAAVPDHLLSGSHPFIQLVQH